MSEFDKDAFIKVLFNRNEDTLIDYLKTPHGKLPESEVNRLFQTMLQNRFWEALAYGVDSNLVETDLFEYESISRTPLEYLLKPYLSKEEDWEIYLPIFNRFLANVDDINEEIEGHNLLSYAIDNKSSIHILKALIDTGIRMDYQDRYGLTYLHQFCKQLRMPPPHAEEVVQLLLDAGVDIHAQTVTHETALFTAIEAGNLPTIKILLEAGADVNQVNANGYSLFYIAAAHRQDVNLLKLLLDYGLPDFSQLNKEKENLLNGFLRYLQGGESGLAILRLLMDNGAVLTDTSEYYHRPKAGIDWVAEKPSEVLAFLLEHHYIDVNGQDDEGNTILMKVCAQDSNHEETKAKQTYRKVKMLLKHGADPTIENTQDKKALDYAMEDQLQTKVVELLIGK